MLRFPSRPSDAALHLITEALGYAAFEAEMCDELDWGSSGTLVSRCFSRELAIRTMKAMLHHLALDEVYQVTDYHWLLLHDALECIVDITGCDPECQLLDGLTALATEDDSWFLGRIDGCIKVDLTYFEDAYFWDGDFLMHGDALSRMSPVVKVLFRASEETWGVTQGMAPHPSELAFEVV